MSEFNINVEGGSSVRLPTAGKYCDRDIIVTASGGGGDNPLQYLTLQNSSQVFRGCTFPEDYHFILRFVGNANTIGFGYFLAYTNVKKVTLKWQIDATTLGLSNAFMGANKMTEITFENETIAPTSLYATFSDCISLENINGTIDASKCTSFGNAFTKCYALREFRFTENSIKTSLSFAASPNLSVDSKNSIFNGLALVETTQTLTLPANLKILQSQVDSANAKGWTVAGGVVVSEEEYYE